MPDEPRYNPRASAALLDEDGWPILENADADDLRLAFQAAGGYAPYGNFVRAVLAGIYAERASHADRVPTALDFPNCRACRMWEDAGASWPRPCKQHYGGEPK